MKTLYSESPSDLCSFFSRLFTSTTDPMTPSYPDEKVMGSIRRFPSRTIAAPRTRFRRESVRNQEPESSQHGTTTRQRKSWRQSEVSECHLLETVRGKASPRDAFLLSPRALVTQGRRWRGVGRSARQRCGHETRRAPSYHDEGRYCRYRALLQRLRRLVARLIRRRSTFEQTCWFLLIGELARRQVAGRS